MNQGIIIQARTGSKRLPGKVLLPFFQQYSILEIIIKKIHNRFPNIPLMVATTHHSKDLPIVNLSEQLSVPVWKGDENNVLNRFIEAAESLELEKVIRVCADNPFLEMTYLGELLANQGEEDYLSYQFPDGTPVIKSHIGIFAEATRLSTLKKVAKLTKDKLYLEHVTNFIYSHPAQFTSRWIEVPSFLKDRKDLRFTVDTKEDFNTQQALFKHFYHKELADVSFEKIVNYVSSQSDISTKMNQQIKLNSK